VKEGRTEAKPDPVSATTTRAGDARARWAWVEPSVWTARMLGTLETGVKGGRWYSLFDKVHADANLRSAYRKVAANKGSPGVDRVTTKRFGQQLDEEISALQEHLRTGTYRPSAIRRVMIPKAGRPGEFRPLGIPTVRDRVAQTALRNVLEPIFEAGFAEHSYGFRPGRSAKDALRRVEQLINAGLAFVVDADIKGYFDAIPHGKLLERMREKVTDGAVLALLEAYLTQTIVDGSEEWTPTAGTPQGAVISPLLANAYLDPLDHRIARRFEMVRYADDFVILCATEGEAHQALSEVQEWMAEAGLTLHPEKTRLVNLEAGGKFDFLGYTLGRGTRRPSRKSLARFRDSVRSMTPRTAGRSLAAVIVPLNRYLRGWFQYFRHGKRWMMKELDGWVRKRLRGILWKQAKNRGLVPKTANWRWPTKYFDRYALFSLARARAEVVQARYAGKPPTGEPCA
jgi:RNA-directed DNA polymerase